MKGPTADLLATKSNEKADPFQHFLCGFSGKREKENGTGGDAEVNEPGDSIDQCSCFPTAGSGYDKGWSIDGFNRRELLGIQFFGVIAGEGRRS
jgi:hypothetical protein